MNSFQSELQKQSVSPFSQTIEKPAKRQKKMKEIKTEEDEDGEDTFITDTNKLYIRFYTYRDCIENYLYYLSCSMGIYGILYLHLYVILCIVYNLMEQK